MRAAGCPLIMTFGDPRMIGVRRTDAGAHVAHPRGGHAADQDGRGARRQDRAADVCGTTRL